MIIDGEEFRIILGFEDYYVINCDGSRLRSLDRYVNDKGSMHFKKGCCLKPQVLNGYLTYSPCKNGKYNKLGAHVFVALAWIGPRPSDKPNVLHKDDNKKNNHYTNLYWGTNSNNVQDAIRNGKLRMKNNGGLLLLESEVRDILQELLCGARRSDLAKRFGVTYESILNIEYGYTWDFIGG